MRNGLNPLRSSPAPAHLPHEVASVITHLPNESGYHAGRFEVVKACLLSMRADGIPVMVWDNGSCDKLRSWLVDEYRPDFLTLSPNVGKWSARRGIVRMFEPDALIGFTDDDMLFYPGWWNASREIMNTFPNVGAVSAWPARISFRWGIKSSLEYGRVSGTLERGQFIPENELIDYAVSVGSQPADHLRHMAREYDYRVTCNGVAAYATAQHCQFIARAGVIEPFCKANNQASALERPFDESIDNAGLLRLTTVKRYALHMGNVIDDKLRTEIMEVLK